MTLFNGSDNHVVAVIIVDLNANAVAHLFAKQSLAKRYFLQVSISALSEAQTPRYQRGEL